jgi:hypothetical protein
MVWLHAFSNAICSDAVVCVVADDYIVFNLQLHAGLSGME